jgi:autotransporter-associated beta strand protein
MKIATIKLIGKVLVMLGGALLSAASAEVLTWTGGAADDNLSSAENWSLNRTPAAGDVLLFSGNDGAALTLTNDLAVALSQIQVNGTTAYTISGGSLTLLDFNNSLINNGAGALTVTANLVANDNWLNIRNGNGTHGDITLTGTVSSMWLTNSMIGGTLTLGAVDNGANGVYLAGTSYAKTVAGNLTGSSFANTNGWGGDAHYGEIRLTGANTFANGVQLIDANLVLDYVAADQQKISSNGYLQSISASVNHIYLLGGTTQETMSGILLGGYSIQSGVGHTVIDRSADSAVTINLTGDGLRREAFGWDTQLGEAGGGAATLDLGVSGLLIISTNADYSDTFNNTNISGILRPWVTVGHDGSAGRDWAYKDSETNAIKAFTNYNTGTDAVTSANDNVYFTGGGAALEGSATMNSLKLNSVAGDPNNNLFNLAGQTLTVKSGGLLYVGAQNYTIDSGTLRMGQDNYDEFLVWQSGAGELVINADIVARNLTKAGDGSLTLAGQFNPQAIASATTGWIAINGGELKLDADWGDSTAHMVLLPYSGTLNLHGHDLRVLAVGSDGASAAPAVITNDAATLATLTIAANSTFYSALGGLNEADITGNVALNISGNIISNNGNGLTTFKANTFTGGVTISDNLATLLYMRIQNAGWFGTGTLHLAGSGGVQLVNGVTVGWDDFTTPLRVTGSGNLIAHASYQPLVFNNAWSGDGELILASISEMMDMNARNVRVNADLSAFTGTLRLRSGMASLGAIDLAVFSSNNTVADWSTANVVMDAAEIYGDSGPKYTRLWLQSMVENQVFKIGSLSSSGNASVAGNTGGSGATGNQFILRSGVATGVTLFEIGGANHSSVFDGHLSNYGDANWGNQDDGYNFEDWVGGDIYIVALTKVGSGTLTLTNLNTYTGTTTVSGGVLLVSGSGSLTRTAGVNVSAGGAFVYDSVVALDRNVSVQSGGIFGGSGTISGALLTLEAGAGLTGGGVLSTGTLTLSGALTLSDLIYQWDIAADDDYDWLDFSDGLILSGDNIVQVNALNGLDGLSDRSWTILSGQTSGLDLWSLTQAAADAGFTLDFQGANLLLNYSAIPEPSTWALMVTGVALLAILRRRR